MHNGYEHPIQSAGAKKKGGLIDWNPARGRRYPVQSCDAKMRQESTGSLTGKGNPNMSGY